MDNTAKMNALLGELRREMNGAVSQAMRERGIDYGLNLGVSLPTIRSLARKYFPDNGLGRFLFGRPVRELQLAAFFVTDAATCTPDDVASMAAGVRNIELAENFSMFLVQTPFAEEFVLRQLGGTDNVTGRDDAARQDETVKKGETAERVEAAGSDNATERDAGANSGNAVGRNGSAEQRYLTYAALLALSRIRERFGEVYAASVTKRFLGSADSLLRRAAENMEL